MKKVHLRQYEAALARRCDEAERKLKDGLGHYVDNNDPEGLQKIPELAEQLGGPIQRELEETDRLKSNMSNWKSSARDFSETHERWSDVRDGLRDGAAATYDRWERALDDGHRRCDQLAKQRQHREVQNALTRLGQSSGVREQLYREMDEHLGRIADLVKNLQDHRDDAEITNAVGLADKLSDTLAKLSNAKGKDRRAEEVVNRWPGYVERYGTSARALKELKRYQFTIDKAPEGCIRKRDELLAVLLSSERGKGREAIRLAQEIGTDIKERLRKTDGTKSDVQRARRSFLAPCLPGGLHAHPRADDYATGP